MHPRLIQHVESLISTLDKPFSRKKAQPVAAALLRELSELLANSKDLAGQLAMQTAATDSANEIVEKQEGVIKKLIAVTQKQTKTIVAYQAFIKTNIPVFLEKAEAIKNDVDILIVGLQTLNEHFNKILESLSDYQLKNRTITKNAQATTVDLASTSKIMDAVANDALEFEKKLPEFQNIISQIKDLSERLGVIVINAGIQSAHAGPFGRSFAVITQEIAKLNNDIQSTLIPQQESFIKEKIIPTITQTTANATNGNQKLHQNITNLQDSNELSSSIIESLDSMIEAIRDIKETIVSFMENLTGIQANMDGLVTSIKGIKTIQAEIFDYQASDINPADTVEEISEELPHPQAQPKTEVADPKETAVQRSHISWLDYKGKKILYFDFSNHGANDEAVILRKLEEAAQIYQTTKENNIRIISNVTNCVNTPRVYAGFKALRAAGKGRIKHSVLVGATGSREGQAMLLGLILGKLTLVKTFEEALEFHATH